MKNQTRTMAMKNRMILTSAVAVTALMGATSAATVVFDDLSSGGYSIGSSGTGDDNSEIVTPFADSRLAWGNGFPNWSSTVDISAGVFTYTLDLRGDPSTNQWLTLSYRSSLGNMSLLGYDSFVIHVESLIGTGQIMAYIGSGGGPGFSVIPVDLSEGDLIIPFANMAATNLENPTTINFRIIPQDRDFSITISGIGVIPEPSTAAIAGLGAFLLTARRQRQTR